MLTNKKHKKGFTLIELLIVIAIIAVLVTIGIMVWRSARIKADNTKKSYDLAQVGKALTMYYNSVGEYPEDTDFDFTSSDFQISDGQNVYMQQVPAPPSAIGACDESDNEYTYKQFSNNCARLTYCDSSDGEIKYIALGRCVGFDLGDGLNDGNGEDGGDDDVFTCSCDSEIQICFLQQLDDIRNNLLGDYCLGRDLDFDDDDSYDQEYEGWEAKKTAWTDEPGWEPIGDSDARFNGKFDGNNRKIKNLFINTTNNHVGLFGHSSHATIENLKIEDADVTGELFSAILSGQAIATTVNNIELIDCKLTGGNHSGGMVGYGSLTANNSFVYNIDATVGNYSGGFIGSASTGSIQNSAVIDGTVRGTGSSTGRVGGFVGRMLDNSVISKCYSTANVEALGVAGGFVGHIFNGGDIDNCYSTGLVTRTSETNTAFGSFIGLQSAGSVTKSYSTGSVYYTGADDPTDKGFCGSYASGTDSDNFWDKETSNQETSAGNATGKITAEMQERDTFTVWDFDEIWQIEEGVSYPTLRWEL